MLDEPPGFWETGLPISPNLSVSFALLLLLCLQADTQSQAPLASLGGVNPPNSLSASAHSCLQALPYAAPPSQMAPALGSSLLTLVSSLGMTPPHCLNPGGLGMSVFTPHLLNRAGGSQTGALTKGHSEA